MRKIIGYFKDYLHTEFHLGLYLSIGLFLALCIYGNYAINFESLVINSFYGKPIRIVLYFIMYAFAYYTTCVLYAYWMKRWDIFLSSGFWLRSLFVLLVLGLDSGSHYHRLISTELPYPTKYFVNKVSSQISSLFTAVLPLFLFYWWMDRKSLDSFYGLTLKNFDWKPYAVLLALMVPLVVAASFNKGFINYYPTLRPNGFSEYLAWPEYISVLIYEFFYGLDFIPVELVFRGFMVLGMMAILGKASILPMVSVYAFLHFGKPAGETISSIFGGFILGVISYYSRSLFGGIIIHMGIAWLMELVAYIQKYLMNENI